MDVIYHFDCTFPAVFTVNGVFFESLAKLKSGFGDSLYITVFPLDAIYLPYTVRLGGGEVFANSTLTVMYMLKKEHYYVRLLPRFNYVYSPVRHEPLRRGTSAARRLFEALKEKDVAAARAMLTSELSASVDDKSLLEFFDGYRDLVENNNYISGIGESFFLIPDSGECATLFKVDSQNGLIDNIGEV